MKNENLTKLLPKTWYFIVFVGVVGYFLAYKLVEISDVSLSGIVNGLYAIGIMWAGLVLGYQLAKQEK